MLTSAPRPSAEGTSACSDPAIPAGAARVEGRPRTRSPPSDHSYGGEARCRMGVGGSSAPVTRERAQSRSACARHCIFEQSPSIELHTRFVVEGVLWRKPYLVFPRGGPRPNDVRMLDDSRLRPISEDDAEPPLEIVLHASPSHSPHSSDSLTGMVQTSGIA